MTLNARFFERPKFAEYWSPIAQGLEPSLSAAVGGGEGMVFNAINAGT